jgi:hypothetical protein
MVKIVSGENSLGRENSVIVKIVSGENSVIGKIV